jgi:hypothetical protein
MYTILKTTPSSIVVSHGDKLVKVLGESFERGHGSPDFIIDVASICDWIVKDKTQPISFNEKQTIVKFLVDELSSKGWSIVAE